MQVVDRLSSNAYGPYGLALGRGAGTIHCLYMWQWIDENRLPQEAGISGPMSIRIRLCQPGTTFDAMAALVDHLTIGRDAGPSYALASNDTAEIVSGPTDAEVAKPAPRKHAKRLAVHRAKTAAVAERESGIDAPNLVSPKPIALSPPVAVPLSMDLPAQAYLGPKAGGSKTN